MKVLLSLLGTVAITSSSAAFASSNVVVGHQQEQARLVQNNSDIDWKTLEKETTNYFDNFKQQQLFSNNFAQNDEMEQAINYAKKVSLSYVQKFAEQNLSLEEIINQISNEYPEFKANYNNSLNESIKNQNIFSNLNLTNFSSREITSLSNANYSDKLKKLIQDLKIGKASVITIASLAAIAAAGFWATSWWFGISIPWAIACTTVSTISSIAASRLGQIISDFEPEANKSDSNSNEALKYAIIKIIIEKLSNYFGDTAEVLRGLGWAFFAVTVVISVIRIIEAWIDAFK